MSPREKLGIQIVKFDPHSGVHHQIVSQLIEAHRKDIQQNILGKGPTGETARQAQTVMRQYDKKMDRLTESLRDRTAVAHIAYRSGTNELNHPVSVPVGFIFSHTEVSRPLEEHLDELQEHFPELAGLDRQQLTQRVLFGEHGYVVPEFQKKRVGADLILQHEEDALKATKGYTHRMISLWGPEAHLEELLKKRGYQRLAVRDSGAVIMAKKLVPTAT